jgi:uncharacterized membrane protein YuzA (DUF378 family)
MGMWHVGYDYQVGICGMWVMIIKSKKKKKKNKDHVDITQNMYNTGL